MRLALSLSTFIILQKLSILHQLISVSLHCIGEYELLGVTTTINPLLPECTHTHAHTHTVS